MKNGGACACMLPINSTNEVVPGGPVSRKKPANQEISGRGRIGCAHAMCTFGRSTIAEAGIFAGEVVVTRRILQHCVGAAGACGSAGLECNGHVFALCGFGATAANVQ